MSDRDRGANVVAAWRARSWALARQGWACPACGRVSLVRRRACAACGQVGAAQPAALARRGTVAAACSAGAAVEHLDQVTGRRAAVLVELEGGARLACLLAHADSLSLMGELVGQPVALAVRRIPLALADDEPIPYGIKAVLDLETRATLKARRAAESRAEPGVTKEQK
jgi:uncharacterized OB-fold protein